MLLIRWIYLLLSIIQFSQKASHWWHSWSSLLRLRFWFILFLYFYFLFLNFPNILKIYFGRFRSIFTYKNFNFSFFWTYLNSGYFIQIFLFFFDVKLNFRFCSLNWLKLIKFSFTFYVLGYYTGGTNLGY